MAKGGTVGNKKCALLGTKISFLHRLSFYILNNAEQRKLTKPKLNFGKNSSKRKSDRFLAGISSSCGVHFSTRSTEVTIKRLLVKQQNWKTRASPKAKLNFHDFQIKPPVKQPISHCSSNFFFVKTIYCDFLKSNKKAHFLAEKNVSYLLLASGGSFPQVYIQG